LKLAIFFAAYKRLPILKICLDGIKRLKAAHKDIEFVPFCVYSNDDEGALLKKYNVSSLKFCNDFLGAKKNAGLKALMGLKWDYMMEIGSDDLVNDKLIDVYRPYFNEGEESFGVSSCYFVDAMTGRVAFWINNYAIGAGRCIKRSVFENFNKKYVVIFRHSVTGTEHVGKGAKMVLTYKVAAKYMNSDLVKVQEIIEGDFGLWTPTKQSALDADSAFNLNANAVNIKIVDVGREPMIVDIKSTQNIHKFTHFEQTDIGFKELLSNFSKKESDGIWKYGQARGH